MKDITFAHDWFAFDFKGHHYEFGYRFSEVDVEEYGHEIEWLKKEYLIFDISFNKNLFRG